MTYSSHRLPYQSPLNVFKSIPDQTSIAFLHSAVTREYSGKYSLIGLFPHKKVEPKHFETLEKRLQLNEDFHSDYFSGGWVGYFSYDLKNQFEELPYETEEWVRVLPLMWVQFGSYLYFDNIKKKVTLYTLDHSYYQRFKSLELKIVDRPNSPVIQQLYSNFTRETYLEAVTKVKDYIFNGDIFEANLTRKFFGEFAEFPDGKSLFLSLTAYSPSQYSAFLKFDDLEIISSSPERFIKVKNRLINSKPIKGTRPRGKTEAEDERLVRDLSASEKDRAENLMIVDLVRNDIGRVAEIGSVKVPELFKVETYETVHQLVSTIEGKIDKSYRIIDAIKSCFPPGSMTGAPKIRAMEICTEIERFKRGIYSGAIGYIGFDGYVDLSVVIRTLIVKGRKFEFQVGGAIVSDSDPISEYEETLDKAKAIFRVLGIERNDIERRIFLK